MTSIIDFDRSFVAFSSKGSSVSNLISSNSNTILPQRTPCHPITSSDIIITDSFSRRKIIQEKKRLRIISEEEDFGIDFGSDQSLFEEEDRDLALYERTEEGEEEDERHKWIDEIYSTSTEGEEDHFSILSSSPSDVYFLTDHDTSSLSPRPSSSGTRIQTPTTQQLSFFSSSHHSLDPLVGQTTAELIESKEIREQEDKKIEGRRITRRNSQPLTHGVSEVDSRRGSAVSVDSLAGRSDPGICSSFIFSAESSIPEESLSLVEQETDEDSPSPPTESVNMIMDPIETLSHVSLSGDNQPFSLSISFDSYKIDSSDSSDLPDKSLISACEASKAVTGLEMTSSGSGITGLTSGQRQRKRTLSPDLVPAAIQVMEKRRKKRDTATAAHHRHSERHGHDPDSHEHQESGDDEENSNSPNDTLNTPVSKKTDGQSFFSSIVTSINDPIPITGTFKFVA